MTLTPIEFALIGLKKFFIKSTDTSCLELMGIKRFFGSAGRNDSNTNQFGRIGEKNFLMTLDVHRCLEYGNQTFLGSGDSRKLTLSVRVSSARIGWAQKRFHWHFRGTSMYVESGNQTFFRSGVAEMTLTPISSRESAFDSYFLDMMYVEFIKNFFSPNSSELMGVRVISAYWAQKRLIPTF